MLLPEHSLRTDVLRGGAWITFVISLVALGYAGVTWSHPHRGAIVALVVAGMVDAAIVRRRAHRIGAWRHYEVFVTAWNAAHMTAISAACILDGGSRSPLMAVFFLSVAFAAVAARQRLLGVAISFNVVAVLIVTLSGNPGRDWPAGLVRAAVLMVTGAVCVRIASDRIHRAEELRDAEYAVLRRMMRLVEYRDEDTGGHIERISGYCAILGRRLGLDGEACERLRWASTMHDVGKIAVPDAILLKPGPLTPDERSVMERHAEVGHDMLQGSGSEVVDLAATIALTHHERYDGAGYPRGLRGDEIPLEGRITAVADVFDALTSERVYKRAMSVIEAVEIIRQGRGTQFDPQIVDAFLDVLDELEPVRARYRDGHAAPRRSVLMVHAG